MFRKYFSGLGVSLALHVAVLLVAVAVLRVPAGPRATGRAVGFDVEAARAPAAAANPEPVPAVGAPAPMRPTTPAPRRAAAPGPSRSMSTAPSTTTTPSTSTSTTTATTSEAGTGTAAIDPEAVREAIQARIQYPRVARAQGIAGTVIVRFRVGTGGAPEELTIVQSAGEILDDAARRAVERAAPFAGSGWVRVPVEFALRP